MNKRTVISAAAADHYCDCVRLMEVYLSLTTKTPPEQILSMNCQSVTAMLIEDLKPLARVHVLLKLINHPLDDPKTEGRVDDDDDDSPQSNVSPDRHQRIRWRHLLNKTPGHVTFRFVLFVICSDMI
jgi:hypothetical protein